MSCLHLNTQHVNNVINYMSSIATLIVQYEVQVTTILAGQVKPYLSGMISELS